MLKKIVTTVFSSYLISVCAQFTLSGTVRDTQTNDPLINATVQLIGANQNTLTDPLGQFTFSNVKAGSVTVRVRFVGYEEWKKDIVLSSDQTIEVNLVGATLSEEVIVKGTRVSEKSPLLSPR
jgi:iron complex outermembrane receptor protein